MSKEKQPLRKPDWSASRGQQGSVFNQKIDYSAIYGYGPSLGYDPSLGYGSSLGYGPSLEEMALELQPTGTRCSPDWSRVTVEPPVGQTAPDELTVGVPGNQNQPVDAMADRGSPGANSSQTRTNTINEVNRLILLGIELTNKGNYQEALQFLEEALKLAPNNSVIWYDRGVVLSKLNRLQDALDAYQTALAINSNWGEGQPDFAWNNRGVILFRLGRFNEAIQSYQQALALNPGYELAQTNLRSLEAYLSANPSLSNQSQQTSEPEQGNNLLQTLIGGLQGAFNEDQTGDEAIADFLIGLIPIIGQLVDGRDLAAYLYRIVFKRQYNDPLNWVGLALTLVGLVPIVGDLAKFLGKTVVRGGLSALGSNLDDVLKLIRSLDPGFVDDIAQLKGLLAQNWGKGVQAALDRWNTALGQLLNWANGIPDLLFSQQKRQLIEAISEVKSQSDKMLSQAFDQIRRHIDEALDEIGRLLNPNGNLATTNGAPLPNNRVDGGTQKPLRIEGNQNSGRNPEPSEQSFRLRALDELSETSRQNISNWPRDLQIRVNDLLAQGDPVVKAAVQEAAEQSSEDAIARVNRLAQAMQNKPTVPENFTRGEFFARGGTSELFEMEGHPDLLIKPGGGRLPNEARAMVEMEMIGIPTVYVKKTMNNGENVLILQKIDGVGSKDIIGRARDPLNPPQNTEVVTQRTIEDLEEIYRKLQENNANIGDFQFIIRRSDGAVIVNDPVSFTRTRRGPSGDIMNIIERFRKILRNRGVN